MPSHCTVSREGCPVIALSAGRGVQSLHCQQGGVPSHCTVSKEGCPVIALSVGRGVRSLHCQQGGRGAVIAWGTQWTGGAWGKQWTGVHGVNNGRGCMG